LIPTFPKSLIVTKSVVTELNRFEKCNCQPVPSPNKKRAAVGDAKSSQIVKLLVVVTGNDAAVVNAVDPNNVTTDPVSVIDESVNVDAFNHFVIVFAVPDPETPDPDGAAHVPSARKKFVVPPPDAGTKPFNADVNVFNNVVACVPVNVSTLPVAAVTLPKNEPVATCANIALVTTLFAMVVVIAVAPDPVTSPDNVIV
jgi:hypothetical protein